jgi:hypothetical protein
MVSVYAAYRKSDSAMPLAQSLGEKALPRVSSLPICINLKVKRYQLPTPTDCYILGSCAKLNLRFKVGNRKLLTV